MSARELMLYDMLKECSWSITERKSDNQELGGGSQSIQWGKPYWRGRAVYGQLSAAKFQTLDAWVSRRKNDTTFTAYRPLLRAPRLNPSQENTGIGLGIVDTAAGTIVLSGLSANISAGDMISYRTLANGYWVGRALDDVVRVGGVATVEVWPPPMAKHATTPALRLREALGEFKIVGLPQNTEQHTRRGTYAFDFIQHVE